MANGDRKRRKWGCVVACKDADGRIKAARDIDIAPAAIRATHLAENFAFIPFFLFS